MQFFAIIVVLAVAIASGLLTGFMANYLSSPATYFNDCEHFTCCEKTGTDPDLGPDEEEEYSKSYRTDDDEKESGETDEEDECSHDRHKRRDDSSDSASS